MTEAPARPRPLPAPGGGVGPSGEGTADDAPGGSSRPDVGRSEVALPDLGREVAALRRQRGLSVAGLSHPTRIRPALLVALERGDLAALGAPVYVRGHLRAVAAALGADGEAWVRRYAEVAGDRTPPVTLPPGDARGPGRREVPGLLRAVAGAAALLAVLALVGLLGRPGADRDVLDVTPPAQQQGGAGAPQDGAPQDGAPQDGGAAGPAGAKAPGADAPGAGQPAAPARAPAAGQGEQAGAAVVVVRAEGRAWVKATDAGGDVLLEGVLDSGTTRELTAPERLDLVVGAPAAVTLSVPGRPAVPAGDDGTVARWTITPGGLEPTGRSPAP